MEKSEVLKECDLCGEIATCLCFQCTQYFCEKCYKLIHDIKKNNLHKKEKIDNFIPIELKCPKHPGNLLNLFCLDENGKYIIYKYILLLLNRTLLWYLFL
jgi:hypothetical protein